MSLIQFLSKFITEERSDKFKTVLKYRTNYLTVVLEDIFQPQNASAVLRTCDCFGIQDVHIIENRNKFNVDPQVALGASKWLSIEKYNQQKNNSLEAIKKLREKGYRIIATSPHTNDICLEEFDLIKGKAALFFGSEQPGLSDIIMDEADEFLKIPMYGFTESFNISVSAAIILHFLSHKLRNLEQINWELSIEEKEKIHIDWLKKTIHKSEFLENEYLNSLKNKT